MPGQQVLNTWSVPSAALGVDVMRVNKTSCFTHRARVCRQSTEQEITKQVEGDGVWERAQRRNWSSWSEGASQRRANPEDEEDLGREEGQVDTWAGAPKAKDGPATQVTTD